MSSIMWLKNLQKNFVRDWRPLWTTIFFSRSIVSQRLVSIVCPRDLKKKCWIYFRSVTDSKHGTALACTGLRNRQTLSGLIPNTQYFVDVFGIHKTVPGLIFKMASTTFVFNNSNTIELHEDQTEIGRLSAFDKRSSFVFKVNCSTIRLKNI